NRGDFSGKPPMLHRYRILAVASLLLTACARGSVQAPPPQPPGPPAESMTPQPSPAYVWIPGGYVWQPTTRAYVWVPGHWTVPPAGQMWEPGHWESTADGHVWVDGRWKQG